MCRREASRSKDASELTHTVQLALKHLFASFSTRSSSGKPFVKKRGQFKKGVAAGLQPI